MEEIRLLESRQFWRSEPIHSAVAAGSGLNDCWATIPQK